MLYFQLDFVYNTFFYSIIYCIHVNKKKCQYNWKPVLPFTEIVAGMLLLMRRPMSKWWRHSVIYGIGISVCGEEKNKYKRNVIQYASNTRALIKQFYIFTYIHILQFWTGTRGQTISDSWFLGHFKVLSRLFGFVLNEEEAEETTKRRRIES